MVFLKARVSGQRNFLLTLPLLWALVGSFYILVSYFQKYTKQKSKKTHPCLLVVKFAYFPAASAEPQDILTLALAVADQAQTFPCSSDSSLPLRESLTFLKRLGPEIYWLSSDDLHWLSGCWQRYQLWKHCKGPVPTIIMISWLMCWVILKYFGSLCDGAHLQFQHLRGRVFPRKFKASLVYMLHTETLSRKGKKKSIWRNDSQADIVFSW